MPRRVVLAVVVGAVALLSLLVTPGRSWAGGPGKWTSLATVNNASDTFGVLRTADGKLHLAWLAKKAGNGTYSYGTDTISLTGNLLVPGTAFSGWSYLEPDPQLVKNGKGLSLIFEGNKGNAGQCYADAAVFIATSATGVTFQPQSGSLDQHTAGVGNLAATTEANGTPVATFGGGQLFHVGVDPSCPASAPDGTIPVPTGNAPSNPAIVTGSDGSVWVGTFQAFKHLGYFVNQIVPTVSTAIEAPGSAGTAAHNNQPLEPVALAARAGGGVYMAYCVVGASGPCVHIDLWKVGSAQPMLVPGSTNVTGARVALAAGPGGRLAIAWWNEGKQTISSVRTNTAATSFGIIRTIKPPPHTSSLTDIQAEDSSGRMDVLINDQLSTAGAPFVLFHTQILPGLSLKASPSSFSHKKTATVTFTVSDAGQPASGAKVSCLGKSGTTSSAGQVKLHFSKGAPTGKHVCTATRSGYNAGKTTIKVT